MGDNLLQDNSSEDTKSNALFIKALMNLVVEIKPLLDNINLTVADNVKLMPGATRKLSEVTEATENATTEIMDIADNMSVKCSKLSEKLENASQQYMLTFESVLSAIQKEISLSSGNTAVLSALTNLKHEIDSIRSGKSSFEENINDAKITLDDINNQLSAIFMTLQVQDITSQQIASVSHLLNQIQSRLSQILNLFNDSDYSKIEMSDLSKLDKDNVIKMHREIAFDPEALKAIHDKDSKQNEVNTIIAESSDNTSEQLSDNEIEALFAQSQDNDSAKEEISQDEIDKLFGNI